MISGRCKTNLVELKHEVWPTMFVAVPRVGEWVKSESGKVLNVVKVTHSMNKNTRSHDFGAPDFVKELLEEFPEIIVELHRIA